MTENNPYQLFDALDPATEAALRASINRWGVIVPVVEDQHGNILDGHHRSRIANELGIDYDRTVMVVDDEAQAVEVAKTLNTDRRHLTIEQRRELVADLRAQGYSLRAIAGAVGVDAKTVRNDLSGGDMSPPEPVSVLGLDGKRYSPTQAGQVKKAADSLTAAEPDRLDDVWPEASAIVDTADDVEHGVAQAVESRRTPMAVPKKRANKDTPPHPATYSAAIIAAFRELLDGEVGDGIVLDPFGGTGGIHQLADSYQTVAIEIEAEWASVHPRTIHGDSRNARQLLNQYAEQLLNWQTEYEEPFDAERHVDAIITSPAYGNRLADDYNASDPEARHSYAIDLGRSLTEGNGAGLHFNTDGCYEQLHCDVWWEMAHILRPYGGILLLNCKDFQRNGVIEPVTGWHINELAAMGFVCEDIRILPAAGLPFASAKPISEVVLKFRIKGLNHE